MLSSFVQMMSEPGKMRPSAGVVGPAELRIPYLHHCLSAIFSLSRRGVYVSRQVDHIWIFGDSLSRTREKSVPRTPLVKGRNAAMYRLAEVDGRPGSAADDGDVSVAK